MQTVAQLALHFRVAVLVYEYLNIYIIQKVKYFFSGGAMSKFVGG